MGKTQNSQQRTKDYKKLQNTTTNQQTTKTNKGPLKSMKPFSKITNNADLGGPGDGGRFGDLAICIYIYIYIEREPFKGM